MLCGGKIGAAELEDVASRMIGEEVVGRKGVVELAHARRPEPELGEQRLGISSVVLEPVAEAAAADHLEAVAAKGVLDRAQPFRDRFEQDDALFARGPDPVELRAPVLAAFDHAGERAAGHFLADRNAHLVPVAGEAQVERAEIAGFGDAEAGHRNRTRLAPGRAGPDWEKEPPALPLPHLLVILGAMLPRPEQELQALIERLRYTQ